MITNRDILITGQQPLDNKIGSNCINIALEFAKNNRVLYVNYPLSRKTIYTEKHDPFVQKRIDVLKGKAPSLVQISENLWNLNPNCVVEPINQLKPDFLFDIVNRINNRRFASEINKALLKLGFKNYIHFNDSDIYRSFYLDKMLNPAPKVKIYYTRDNMVAVDYWKTHGLRIESQLMAKSDFVTANSPYLATIASKYNKKSYYVGQGCDVSKFDPALVKSVPTDIKDIPKPIIGYIGVLYSLRLDIHIIEHIAASHPDWHVVLVGPEDEAFKQSNLHQMANVHFLGNKHEDELPAYLNRFDVAINPQILNDVTIGNYPRKIDEYLAMGKPTIATKTETMSVFRDFTILAKNKEEYVSGIEHLLATNSSELELKRMEFAKTHTWENNVLEIYKLITKFESNTLET